MSALDIILDRQRGFGALPEKESVSPSFVVDAVPPVRMPVRTAAPAAGLSFDRAPHIFGSIALPLDHSRMDGRWRRVKEQKLRPVGGAWTAMLDQQRGRSATAQLMVVNRWVNTHVTFTPDGVAAGRGDRWAGAAETLRTLRGDCEDYAIAKLQLLRTLGFADRDLYLVIAHDMVRRQDHAVLVVRTGGMLAMLDTGTDRLIDARATSDYRPILSFSGTRAWTHGYAVLPKVQFAARGPVPVFDPS